MSVRQVPPTDRIASSGLTRYDLLLAAIPTPLLLGLLVALVTGLTLQIGVVVGSFGSALVVGYGLFSVAPTDDENAMRSFALDDD